MEITKPFLQHILQTAASTNLLFKRSLVKEYLQILVLQFIYSHPKYSALTFYGGSCLAHVFELPRLSEDLDFVDLKKNVKITELAKDLNEFFHQNTDLTVKTTVQKFRIYLKFRILKELALSEPRESDLLFVKVEVFSGFDFCKEYQTRFIPLFKFNRSVLIHTFELPTLMATKLRAIMYRQWIKTSKKGETLISVKGRDYFDLLWYLQKNIQPNWACLKDVGDLKEIKIKLLTTIERLDPKSIQLDLEAFIQDTAFVKNLSPRLREMLKKEIEEKW